MFTYRSSGGDTPELLFTLKAKICNTPVVKNTNNNLVALTRTFLSFFVYYLQKNTHPLKDKASGLHRLLNEQSYKYPTQFDCLQKILSNVPYNNYCAPKNNTFRAPTSATVRKVLVFKKLCLEDRFEQSFAETSTIIVSRGGDKEKKKYNM